MSVLEVLIRVIAPHHCVGCGQEGRLLCAACVAKLATVPPRCYRCNRTTKDYRTCKTCRNHSEVFAVYPTAYYQEQLRTLVHKLKFGRAKAAASELAQLLVARLPVQTATIVVYLPTAPERVRQRGYDQAALIAKQVARLTGLPYAAALARSGTQRQLGQTRQIRQQQMAQVFRVLLPKKVANQHVLLVDDVLTTGATCQAAAAVLKTAGAQRVSVAVCAVA